jgi:hypothetical protein
VWQLQHALQTIGFYRPDLFQSRSTILAFWSLKINLLDANKQPTQTNFQLAAKQLIQHSNRRLKLTSRPNDEMQQEVDSIFSPFRFFFLIVIKPAKKSLKTIWRFTDSNE